MSDEQVLRRPIGWWLKEADSRLDAAFDAALCESGAGRRDWQVLASLSRGPMNRAELVASLVSFDPPAVIAEILDHMQSNGWIEESESLVLLTRAGSLQQESLGPLIEGVRQQIAEALPQDDYVALVGLLARLVAALRPTT